MCLSIGVLTRVYVKRMPKCVIMYCVPTCVKRCRTNLHGDRCIMCADRCACVLCTSLCVPVCAYVKTGSKRY